MLHSAAVAIVIAGGFLALNTGRAGAQESSKTPIEFDSKLSVGCRDVTPKDFAQANPDHRILEANVRVSANFSISETSIDSIVYRFVMPAGVELADYLPKTELASDVSGPIETSRNAASKQGLVVVFEGGAKVGYRIPSVLEVGANVSGSRREETAGEVSSGVQMKLLPPRQLIVAAGTEARGTTLYFKLRPFSQITLEGEKEFACLMIVPKEWSGSYIKLECIALAKDTRAVGVEQDLGIGVYPLGDRLAKARVEKSARAVERRKSIPEVFSSHSKSPAVATETAPAPPPASTIVAKWQNDRNASNTIEFFPDGTSANSLRWEPTTARTASWKEGV